jgi:hypothetical protein
LFNYFLFFLFFLQLKSQLAVSKVENSNQKLAFRKDLEKMQQSHQIELEHQAQMLSQSRQQLEVLQQTHQVSSSFLIYIHIADFRLPAANCM